MKKKKRIPIIDFKREYNSKDKCFEIGGAK